MSRDIRSFFTTISKKVVPTKASLNTSDIVPNTPEDTKKNKKPSNKKSTGSKRKRIVTLNDSDSESDDTVKSAKTPKKEPAKPAKILKKEPVAQVVAKKFISALEVFGDAPVKQSKVQNVKKETEAILLSDDDFEKSLLDLDEDDLLGQTPKKDIGENKNEPEVKSPKKVANKTPNRKRKHSSGEDCSNTITDEERHERKRHSAMLYQKYLNRSGPIHLGSKWIPKGKPDCLKNLCFIITGVLESLEREQAEKLIKEHGGRCTSSISGKVNYMVLGEDAGPAKVEKARKLGTKVISEDDLIDLICIKSDINNQNTQSDCSTSNEKPEEQLIKKPENQTKEQPIKKPENQTKVQPIKKTEKQTKEQPTKKLETQTKEQPTKKLETQTKEQPTKKIETQTKEKLTKKLEKQTKEVKVREVSKKSECDEVSLQWVDKYKPKNLNEIIGQQGDRSNVKKLSNWLETWQKNRARGAGGKGIPRPSPWAKDDEGAYFRAALLSGPPGVGKTTTATLVCKKLGFDTVEFNASDTRNKKMVHHEVAQIIKSTSLAGFFNDGSAPSRRHVLLMDEVDGMSGNEDRGGIQELIVMIKTSNIPIICMCNDRQHPKIRTLANYCFDLRFSKPRLEQIRGAMMSICFKEGIKIEPDVLSHIIQGTCQDVRQTLNQLSLYSANTNTDSKRTIEKDVKLGPWEVIRKVFSQEEHKTMSLIDKSKLFFHDYSIGPLFVHENYLKVVPHCPKNEQLERFANAADAISMGDVIDSRIRSTQNWTLLDLHGMYASVLPGHYLEGHFGGQIDFPGWLGKNSKTNKFQRMLSEINAHTRMSITGDRTAICLDYVRYLRDAITNPMLKRGSEGIPDAMAVMRAYNLLREDVTNLVELAHWPKTKDPFDGIDSKVKAAFTRTYNKEAPALPYAAPGAATIKNKRATVGLNEADDAYNEYDADADEADDPNDDDDITNDGMIKAKKAISKAASTSKGKTGTGGAKTKTSKRSAKK